MKTRRLVSILALLAVILAGSGQASLAGRVGGGPADLPHGMWYDAGTGAVRTDALRMDALLVAKRQGISADAALARLDAQQRMDGILGTALERYPQLVGLRWDNGRAVAQFKGHALAGALELLASAGVAVDHELVGYSASELDELQGELARSLQQMGHTDFAVARNAHQRIVATVGSDHGGGRLNSIAATKQSIMAALPARLVEASVDIDVVDGPVAGAASVYGGTDARINTTFWCTIGFTVFSGSTNGVGTDGHCGTSMNRQRDWVTGVVWNMTYQSRHVGQWGDFEWLTTAGTEVDDFYIDEHANRRDVTGVKNSFSYGDSIIWFGRASNDESLGAVEWLNVDTSGPDRLNCLNTEPYQVQTGDSGGPVYIGNTAAGFVWGWIVIEGLRRDCFSQARYIDDAIGVSIKQ